MRNAALPPAMRDGSEASLPFRLNEDTMLESPTMRDLSSSTSVHPLSPQPPVTRGTYAGLLIVSLATLMYEILLTRIFSVTMWYHFAFVAVSIAMFGMTVGAMIVYLFPRLFSSAKLGFSLSLNALLFAVTIVISFYLHLQIRFTGPTSMENLFYLGLTYVVIAVPFIFSGICVSLTLTRFPSQVGRLYGADLAGASLGCILLIVAINATSGPTAVVIVAFLAAVGGLCYSWSGPRKIRLLAIGGCCVLAGLAAQHSGLLGKKNPSLRMDWLRPKWVKGELETVPILYEKWNSFSRVTVVGYPEGAEEPFGWGLSSAYTGGEKVGQIYLNIDAGAGTVLTSFQGPVTALEYLKYDVTNLAHYLRPGADVLVVGTGGGRDILSALAFGQRSVVGVEINGIITRAVNRRFGDFTGHLDRYPNVTFVTDEARSYVTRQKRKFDIIQISLIDTWAATAAGAFVLSENSLYTVEAWKALLTHLKPGGVLTVSRYYLAGSPTEAYRLTSLAAGTLRHLGVQNPRDCIMLIKHGAHKEGDQYPAGVGTILVSQQPFSRTDRQIAADVARRMAFDVVLSPTFSLDSTFDRVAAPEYPAAFLAALPADLSAPTDDRPFFFHLVRARELLNPELWKPGGHLTGALGAVIVLGGLLAVVVLLTFLFIVVPLLLTLGRAPLKSSAPLAAFFFLIGSGFMLIEVSQMQRLMIFLGHPTYGLSVVLFSLLLSSGVGSFFSQRLAQDFRPRLALKLLLFLVCVQLLWGKVTPYVVGFFASSTTPVRIGVSAIILFTLGIFMGTAFPLGMMIASRKSAELAPWLWGINGATSVCASVVAVVIALQAGISSAFWAGTACYAVAVGAFFLASRNLQSQERARLEAMAGGSSAQAVT